MLAGNLEAVDGFQGNVVNYYLLLSFLYLNV